MGINVLSDHHDERPGNEKNEVELTSSWHSAVRALTTSTDNISGKNQEHIMTFPPVDIVYTWVNGSDPKQAAALLQAKLAKMTLENGSVMRVCNETENVSDGSCYKDEETASRFQDNQEMLYSLRSVWKHAPWVRNIYIITNGQIPSWLNLQHPRIHMVTHKAIFANSSHLPTFSSPAIEANMHRIPGLSEHFIYLNDDVMFGRPLSPSDFYTYGNGQRVYYSWPVPDCAEGCGASWVGDGYCDVACNVSACGWDNGDCENVTTPLGTGWNWNNQNAPSEISPHCSPGCLDTWIGDRYCDRTCRNPECGMDAGDCGMELVFQNINGMSLLSSNVLSISPSQSPSEISSSLENVPIIHVGDINKGHNLDFTSVLYFNLSSIINDRILTESAYSNPSLIRVITISPKNKVMVVFFKPAASEVGITDAPASPSDSSSQTSLHQNSQNISHSSTDLNSTNAQNSKVPSSDNQGRIFISFTSKDEASNQLMEHLFYLQLHKLTQPETSSNSTQEASVPVPHAQPHGEIQNQVARELLWLENEDEETIGKSELGDDMSAFSASVNVRLEEKTLRRLLKNGITREQIELERNLISRSGMDGFDYLGLFEQLQNINKLGGSDFSSEITTQIKGGRRLLDNYADSLRHVNALLNKAFSPEVRRVPAHMPHYLQKSVIERMIAFWPAEFEKTSRNPLRSGDNMQYALSYFYYYMSERVAYNFTEVWSELDVDGDGVLNVNEMRTVAATLVRSEAANPRPNPRTAFINWNAWANSRIDDPPAEPVQKWLEECDALWIGWMPELGIVPSEPVVEITEEVVQDAKARLLNQETVSQNANSNSSVPSVPPSTITQSTRPVDRLALYNITELPSHWNMTRGQLEGCESAMKPLSMHYKARLRNRFEVGNADEVAFVMVPTNRTSAVESMDGIRHKRHKFICLNDNINHTDPHAPEVVRAIHDFYKALFPSPSPFELPEGQINKFLHTDDLIATRTEIKRKKTQIYILVGFVIFLLLIALKFFAKGRPFSQNRNSTSQANPGPVGGMLRDPHHMRHPDPVIIRTSDV